MLGRLLRRLFRRNRLANVPPERPESLPPAPAPMPGLAVVPVVAPDAATLPSDHVPAIDYPALYRTRLDALRSTVTSDPALADAPDAGALLQLLADGPDVVIRQLPAAARDALALCDDPALSRSQLADRLSNDPALVQGLLRTANSAALASGRGPVLGIDQALDRIGLSGARAVVLASCVDGLLSHPGGEFNAMAAEVWSHMVRTAPLARAIASAFAADPDEAFAIALLHDVGKLVVFDRISTLRAMRRRSITLPAPFVHGLLQQLHEPLGAMAAERWGMGARAAAAIGAHHRGEATPQRDPLAETLYVAEQADHAIRKGSPFDMDALWTRGRLTGSPARAASALQSLLAAA